MFQISCNHTNHRERVAFLYGEIYSQSHLCDNRIGRVNSFALNQEDEKKSLEAANVFFSICTLLQMVAHILCASEIRERNTKAKELFKELQEIEASSAAAAVRIEYYNRKGEDKKENEAQLEDFEKRESDLQAQTQNIGLEILKNNQLMGKTRGEKEFSEKEYARLDKEKLFGGSSVPDEKTLEQMSVTRREYETYKQYYAAFVKSKELNTSQESIESSLLTLQEQRNQVKTTLRKIIEQMDAKGSKYKKDTKCTNLAAEFRKGFEHKKGRGQKAVFDAFESKLAEEKATVPTKSEVQITIHL